MDLKAIGYDIVSSGLSLFAVSYAEPLLPQPQSDVQKYLQQGLMWSTADSLVDWYTTGQSELTNSDWLGFADKVGFNTVSCYAVDKSGIVNKVYQELAPSSPLPQPVNVALLSAGFKVASTNVANWIDRAYSGTPLHYLVHPTRLIKS
jgi:hypothetical protein